jgi:membrane protease subunit (stomatin/prohibitin family)
MTEKFVPDDVRQDFIDGMGKIARLVGGVSVGVINGTAKMTSEGVAYVGRIVKKSEQNADLVHKTGHASLNKFCPNCGNAVGQSAFCSSCGTKQS